ncbi:DUF4240 domain-containing protein [Allosphingosinicella deserti]|nr:DUF4240 domain-containing protein [Sphingomonas deserti]
MVTNGMDEARFWALIEQFGRPDREARLAALRAALADLEPDDIQRFQAQFDRQMWRSYRWDLWGAAFVAMGGASDDGFEYFRAWLIAQGRDAFERVLGSPDSLADIAPNDADAMEFEHILYVAPEIWSEKTGKSPAEMIRFDPGSEVQSGPQGTPFREDDALLARQYPHLWRRFTSAGM